MRQTYKSHEVSIPEGVDVKVKARHVTVTGPRGELSRSFRSVQCLILKVDNKIVVEMFCANYKNSACVRSVGTHIKNMMTGVSEGFECRLRAVNAHFPISVKIAKDGNSVDVTNFIGQKAIIHIPLREGVTIKASDEVKDEFVLTGNCIENVNQSAANITQKLRVRHKDNRMFLDGIYPTFKGAIQAA